MTKRQRAVFNICWLVLLIIGIVLHQRHALAMPTPADISRTETGHGIALKPGSARPTITAHVRPELLQRMRNLRPEILSAAARHNRPELSGMSDAEFAVVLATIIYNENFGWLEDDIAPLRPFTPLYQDLQRRANSSALGSNFSVWPTNLRPSVAVEILRRQLPLADQRTVYVPVEVAGSRIKPDQFSSQEALYAAITAEISRDDLAIAYLAANLERGIYRAALEGVPINWRSLAAWHNQGIVDPRHYRANPTSRDYLRRASAYLGAARDLIEGQWVVREHIERV